MNKCKKCGQEKFWNGSDITCSFQESDTFGENWNCGIVNQIREICELDIYGVNKVYCEDQYYATINVDNVDFEDKNMLALYVSWYKNRGATDAMWLLDECDIPIKPTYNDLEAIVKYYKNNK